MLGDWRFAALATFSVASTFLFQRQARTASYDIHYVAWTTVAVGLGIWAMNPLGPAPIIWRRLAGWGGCAIAFTAAVMSKNPLPYVLGVPPLIAMIVMLSQRRRVDALIEAGRIGARLCMGVFVMLLFAAFVEAFWSSIGWIPALVKYGVGVLLHESD